MTELERLINRCREISFRRRKNYLRGIDYRELLDMSTRRNKFYIADLIENAARAGFTAGYEAALADMKNNNVFEFESE